MSSAIRKVISTVGKNLVRPDVIRATRNAASQANLARVADRYDETYHEHGQGSVELTPEKEAFQMYVNTMGDTLHINMENVPNTLQAELIDRLGPLPTVKEDLEQIQNIRVNNIAEEVYRHKLYMPLKKLGYDCMFTRYNHDRGLASFDLKDTDTQVKRNYFRSKLPNRC